MVQATLKIQQDLVEWLSIVGDQLRRDLHSPLKVSTKSGRNDLVTNLDKQTEQFYVQQIRAHYPEAHICGEEGFGDQLTDLSGLVFFVDPIDGTMNFVRQKNNFATMIGVYLDGQPLVGAILDVIGAKLLVGGAETGVQLNGYPLKQIEPAPIAEGLLGVNAMMYAANKYHLQDLAAQTSGVRVTGSAGLEFIQVITGQQNGYVSSLSPWDVAAGWAIGQGIGIEAHNLAGQQPQLRDREVIIAGIPEIWRSFQKLQN